MNKIYKIVWNASLGAWVAVSEIAKGKTKANSGTIGNAASSEKIEIAAKEAFNYKALSLAVLTVLAPSFAFAAIGTNSIDTPNCSSGATRSSGDIAVGCGTDSSGTNSIAIGGNATTKVNAGNTQGGQSIAIGYDAQTKGDQSVGLGANIRAAGNSSIAIGGDDLNKVAGTNNNTAAAVTYKNLTGDNLIRTYDNLTGPNNQYYGTTTGDGAVAIGVQASALGNLSTSFGTRTQANGVASTALGVGATSDKDGSVALGAGSKTDGAATKVQNATVNGVGFTGFVGASGFAGTASDAGRQVSVGNIGNERQIKNVAPGAISATSTDAINGSQIYAVTNTLIGQMQTNKAASPVVYTDAFGNKLTKANDNNWYASASVDADGDKIGTPTAVAAANVITSIQNANGSTTAAAKLTNVADGTIAANSKDAVNGGQLKTVSDAQGKTDNYAVKYDDNAGVPNKDSVTLAGTASGSVKDPATGKITTSGGTSLNNVASAGDYTDIANASKGVNAGDLNNAVIDAKTAVTNTGIKFGNGTTANQYKLGDTINVKASADGSITSTATADGVQLGLGNTVKVGSGATQITVDGSTGKIGGLSNKTWNAASITSGQAATEDQLKLVSDAQTATDSTAVKYDSAATKDKVTLGGGAAGTTITNVKAGAVNASSSDAINGGQLHAVSNSIKNAIGGNTSINAVTGAITTTNIGGTGANTIDGAINSVSNTAKAAKTEVKEGGNIKVTSAVGADGQSIYTVATAKDVSFDKVTVGGVVLNKANNDITGLSNKNLSAADFATQGRAATEEQLKMVSDAQGKTDNYAVKYDDNSGAPNKDKVTLAGTASSSVKDPATGKISTIGGTSLNNVASAGDYTDIANAGKGVNAGDLNNAVIDAKTAVTNTGIKFGNGTTANQFKLGDTINVKASADGSITSTATADGVQLGLGNTVKVGSGATQITVDGSTGKIGGLSNKTWNAASITSGQAATEDQLKLVSDAQTATDSTAVKYDSAATKDKVTLGGGAAGTTITNVKAGAVNASSSDAINGGQLHAVSNSIKNAIGGNTSINAVTGAITTTNIGGTGANTIDGAINSVSNTAKAAKTEVKEGGNIKVTSAVGADGQSIYTVATAKDVSFDKVTVGGVVLNKANNDITGLSNKNLSAADFATQGRAATEEQLKMVSDAQGKTDNYAVKYDDNSGAPNKDKVTLAGTASSSVKDPATGKISTIGGTSLNNVASAGDYTDIANAGKGVNAGDLNNAVIDAKTAVTNTGIKFGNGTTASQFKLGDTINVKASADGSITSTATADGVQLGLGNTVKVGSGATQITVDGASGKIGGLSNKTWNASSITSGQAATEDQLKLVSDAQTATDSAAVKYDSAATKDKVTLGGGAAGTTITNVKAGEVNADSSDAINGSQLHAVSNSIKNAIGGNTSINAVTGAITTNNIGGTGANTIDGAITAVKTAADKGISFGGSTGAANKFALGDTIKVEGDSNIASTTTAAGVQLGLSDSISVKDAVNVGSGVTKIKIDGASNTIGGLSNKAWNASSITSGQAATEDQLKSVSDAQGKTDNYAVKYDDNSGVPNKDSVTFAGTASGSVKDPVTGKIATTGGTSLNNVASAGDYTDIANAGKGVNAGDLNNAVIDAKTAVTNTGIKFGNGTTASQFKLGDTINVKASADGSITSTTTADGVQLGLGNSITVGSGAGSNPVTINGTAGKIGGLSNKAWNAASITSGQAATEDQLKSVSDAQDKTDEFAVKYDKNADGSVNKGKVTLGGAGGTTLTNIKAGEVNADSSDAINGGQLHAVSNSIKNAIGGNTSINPVTGAITTSNIGGTGANTIDGAITAVKTAADKGIRFGGSTGAANKFALGDTIKVEGDSNIASTTTAAGVQLGLSDSISVKDAVNVGSGVTKIKIDGASNTIGGLSNKAWNAASITSGQAATEDQLKSVSDAQKATDDAAVKYDSAATKDKVTLGGGAAGTTITNLKAGAVNASSSDAINGGQLHAVSNSIKNAIGGNTSINAVTGAITTTNIGGTGANTIDGAINSVSNTAKAAKTEVKEGGNIKVTSAVGTDGQSIYTVATAKDVSFDKVTVGGVVLNKANNDITGLSNKNLLAADFATQGRAATEEQLKTVSDAQGKTDSYAVKYDDNSGVPNKDSVTFAGTASGSVKDPVTGKIATSGGTSLNNVASAGDYTDIANAGKGVNAGDLNNAVIDAKTAVTNTGIKFGNGTTASQFKLGDTINVKASADGSITSTTTADGVQLGLGNSITVGSGAGSNPVTINGTAGKIGGLSNKAWNAASITSGQAATEDQLKLVSDAQTATDSAAVKYDSAATKDKVTLGGGAAGTTITNVKAGAVNASSSDAINGSQLYTVSNSIKNAIGGSTTINAVTGAITTTNIGGTGANTIDGAINSVSNTAKAAKTEVKEGDNIKVTSTVGTDGQSIYTVATAKDVSFDKVTVGGVVLNKANNDITGLSNKNLSAADFATQGRAATEEQLKQVISSNITEVVDASGNKVNIIDQVVNTKLDNTNQDSLFLTYNKQGQETTDRLTIGQTVQKMNTEGTKFFHTNADTSKGDLGTTNDSSASGLNSTAIGVNAIVAAGADSSVALGHNAKVQGIQSIAIGNGAEALGTQSISIGTGNKVKGNHSGAIGDPTIVNGSNSYSVGNNNQVLTDDTFVLGNNVTKTVAGSVVLGTGSAATTGAGVTGYALSTATNADKAAINKTTSTTGAVAVGDAASGIYRQITGVAAGTQDADAVNVAQLKAVGNQVVTTQNSLVKSLGGNAAVNANGTITGPTYNVAKSTQTNVGDALDALDKAITSTAITSKTTVTKGQNIVVNKSKNLDGSDNYEIATAQDLMVDSVKAGNTVLNNAGITIGNNAVVLNNTGLIIAGGPSITTQGINAGNKQITNVAAGTNATDAVNKGQLDSAIKNVANDVTQLSNNAVKYDTASKDKITLGGANGTTIANVKDGAVAQGSKDAVNGGQLWNVQQQVNKNTNDIQGIQTSISNINNGKSGLVQQQTPNGDITVGKDSGGTILNVSGTQGDRIVTGVKDGAINAVSKDAVNGSQLNTANQKVAEYLGGGAKFENGGWVAPSYTVGHGSTAQSYADVGGAVDALNKADQALGNRITNLGDRLEQAFTETNQRIDGIEKKANAGIAAAMALENAPFIAGKYTYAVGAAYHGGENAIGVTFRKTADNGRWSLTGGVAAASQGDPSVRIGISGVID
nr:ESPR-type extended signal peptide-containing protein [Acinetobacter sp. WCHAc010034]